MKPIETRFKMDSAYKKKGYLILWLLSILGWTLVSCASAPVSKEAGSPPVLGKEFGPSMQIKEMKMAMQAGEKILIGGLFKKIGGVKRNSIARLNPDGSVEAGFDPSADSCIYSIVMQTDGKILVGGHFTTIGGVNRNSMARLNPDGSVETGFHTNLLCWPPENLTVHFIAMQTDGKILVGGYCIPFHPDPDGRWSYPETARLNPDGSVDAGFEPYINDIVHSIVVQADGKILVGGDFTNIGGVKRNSIARLNPDGSVEAGFDPSADSCIYSIVMQTGERS